MHRLWFIQRIRKLSFVPLLSIDTFYSVQWFCQRTAKTLIRLRRCAGWSGPSLSAYARRHFFAWRGSLDNIGIKHGYSCINIRQVPREVLKTEASGLRMLMHWKNMFDRYYCIKTENICFILRYFLSYFVSPFHWCLMNAISTDYARSRAGNYTSRDGINSVAPVRSYWKLRSRALTARELPC